MLVVGSRQPSVSIARSVGSQRPPRCARRRGGSSSNSSHLLGRLFDHAEAQRPVVELVRAVSVRAKP
jgi:hypothetical protein